MSKRGLLVAAVVGILLALLLSVLSGPGRTPEVPVESSPAAERGAGRGGARSAEVGPATEVAGRAARMPGPGPGPGTRSASPAPPAPGVDPAEEVFHSDDEATLAYRCRSLQSHADLTDKLITVASGTGLPDEERAKMLPRVADLALKLHEADLTLRNAGQTCGDGGVVDLAPAGQFLDRYLEDLGELLDDEERGEIDKALALIAREAER